VIKKYALLMNNHGHVILLLHLMEERDEENGDSENGCRALLVGESD